MTTNTFWQNALFLLLNSDFLWIFVTNHPCDQGRVLLEKVFTDHLYEHILSKTLFALNTFIAASITFI